MSSRPGEFAFPFDTHLRDQVRTIQRLLRGGLTVHDNVTDNHIVSYQHTAGADVAQTISITSLKIPWAPTRFIVVDLDDKAVIYATAADKSAWTKDQIVLRASVNNANVKVMVF